MQGISSRKLTWLAMLATAAIGLMAIVAFTGQASAQHGKKAGNATIDMKQQGKKLFFEGDTTVESGQKLKIVNKTNPMQVGPHTFTIVTEDELPQGKADKKKCQRLQTQLCRKIFKAHQVDPMTFEVGKPTVDTGKTGWDRAFTRTVKGDSWVAEAKNESQSRTVSAKAGKTLYYFCLVHPGMQGKIKVVK